MMFHAKTKKPGNIAHMNYGTPQEKAERLERAQKHVCDTIRNILKTYDVKE